MKSKVTDKEMEKVRDINIISAPGRIISSQKTTEQNNDVSCIYDGQNHGVGSVIINEDGRKYICSNDGTWQVQDK
ncbi:hypothetical protein [Tissierella sp. Yu-01]|uniref:hypothetical protein n=1 Tax=Tissierella sp. Yu-01 TaxID=3035694 RepID=UPI00240DB337|nr:hypothetical protein [Tissierella sp. Yu-01]WFA09342.1 hypothetical protein P3962_01845 [Tissierella sp. Yu-01]